MDDVVTYIITQIIIFLLFGGLAFLLGYFEGKDSNKK